MKQVSFDDIGQVLATFVAQDGVARGQVVKLTGNGQVGPCAAGDAFCGLSLSGSGFAGVQVGGFAQLPATGDITLGWTKLAADGSGGVKAATTGREYLVVEFDSTAKTCVVYL